MNTFGNCFRITLYGESHGKEIGIVIDGCPAGIPFSSEDIMPDVKRRSTGGYGSSGRTECDIPEIRSGVYNGHTTGTPILITFTNDDIRNEDYNFDGFFRPGHADYAAYKKYNGNNNPLGGGQFSGRMTLPIVAAGCIAKKIIPNISISATINPECLANTQKAMPDDSAGGIIECRITRIQAGIGEPFFDSLESLIAHAMFSIPGAKAIEFGNGIASANMLGSQYNDCIIDSCGHTATNNCGGINGGISNGNEIFFTTYFHPTPSIAKKQQTFNFNAMQMQDFEIHGRHDVCFALRTPVIVEALTAIVITDLTLISKTTSR